MAKKAKSSKTSKQNNRPSSQPNIVPLDVEDTGFLTENIAKDCPPLQYLREFTQNGIEAVRRRGEEGGIVRWCCHPHSQKLYGERKLCCIDTGDGMSAAQMNRHMGQLSSSGGRQGFDANFGVGAKISALRSSAAGVVYESWQQGKGVGARLARGPGGEYGLEQIDGKTTWSLDPAMMPQQIKLAGGTGTVVTILGSKLDQDTTQPPPGAKSSSSTQWVVRYLNERYFEIPDNIKLVVERADSSGEDPVRGQKWFLDSITSRKQKGTVRFGQVEISWWVQKDPKEYRRLQGEFGSGPRCGLLSKDEIYDFTSGSKARPIIQEKFGVSFGHKKLSLMVRSPDLVPDMSRASLRKQGDTQIDWDQWGEYFRDNLPDAVAKLIRQSQGEDGESNRRKIRNRIGTMLGRLGSPGGRRASESGDITGGPATRGGVASPAERNSRGGSGSHPGQSSSSSKSKSPESSNLSASGDRPARRSRRNIEELYPDVRWVDGRKEDMNGVFARYVSSTNELIFNYRYPAYRDQERYWLEQLEDRQYIQAVRRDLRLRLEEMGSETVVRVLLNEGRDGWDEERVRKSLSDEALSNLALLSTVIDDSLRQNKSEIVRLASHLKKQRQQKAKG